jgi:hypothetical protein
MDQQLLLKKLTVIDSSHSNLFQPAAQFLIILL